MFMYQLLVKYLDGGVRAKFHRVQHSDDEGLKTMAEATEDMQGHLPGLARLDGLLVEKREGVGTIVRTIDDLTTVHAWVRSSQLLAVVVGIALSSVIEKVFKLLRLDGVQLMNVSSVRSSLTEPHTLGALGEPQVLPKLDDGGVLVCTPDTLEVRFRTGDGAL